MKMISLLPRAALLCFMTGLTACQTTQPPAAVRSAAPQSLPARAPMPAPAPAAPTPAPLPAPLPPDYTYLEGHSSRSVPVPVAPVEIEPLEPVRGN